RQLDGHSKDVLKVAFSSDSKYLASFASGDPVFWWDLQTGKVIRTFGDEKKKTEDTNLDDPRKAMEAQRMKHLEKMRMLLHHVKDMALSPNGKIIALTIGPIESTIRFVDTTSGKEVRQIQCLDLALRRIIFSPDSHVFALASQNDLRL